MAENPIPISDILKGGFDGKKAKVRGWVYRKRGSNKVVFMVVRDSSGIIQTITKSDCAAWDDANKLTMESSLEVVGTVHKDERAPGGYELVVDNVKIIGLSPPTFPIAKDLGLEHLLDIRHLWLRSRKMSSVMKIRHTAFGAIHEYFRNNGFYEVQAPNFITAACEGGSTLFELDYFGGKAYLTQSAQLYLESFITSLEKVYTVAPSFRAEKSKTWRHLTEYWHAEAELAFCGFEEIMKMEEELVHHILQKVLEKNKEQLEYLERDVKFLEKIKLPFPRVDYEEGLKTVNKHGNMDLKYGDDIGADEERILTKQFDTPIILKGFPWKIKSFYHMPDPKNPESSLSNDLLAPEGYGEIVGGGERISDLEALEKQCEKFGLNPKDYGWYFDLRKYGAVPHSGFGLGVDRVVMWICGLKHIRDAIPFPRTINRVYP